MIKYLSLFILVVTCSACSSQFRQYAPNHIGVTPSCEWEIQEGNNVKHKPKIQTSFDWNF